jgi:hypothetical protein
MKGNQLKKPAIKTTPILIEHEPFIRELINTCADLIQDKMEAQNLGFESVDIEAKIRFKKKQFDYRTINHAMPKPPKSGKRLKSSKK